MLTSIQRTGVPVARAASPGEPPQKPNDEPQVQVNPDLRDVAERYNETRNFGNHVSGMVLGALKEGACSIVESPLVAEKIVANVWKAETIGPNLKILGTLAAIPGGALSIIPGPFVGAFEGYRATSQNHWADKEPLNHDTANDFAKSVFAKEGNEPRTLSGKMIESLNEFGARKLHEGEKPHDVPLLSPAFAILGGVVSGAVSGVVGLVAGTVAGVITTGKEMKHAVTDKNESVGQRIEQFVFSPLNTVVMGPALAWNGIKESVPRGLVDGWHHGPFKPVIDTVKVDAKLAAGAIKEAWER